MLLGEYFYVLSFDFCLIVRLNNLNEVYLKKLSFELFRLRDKQIQKCALSDKEHRVTLENIKLISILILFNKFVKSVTNVSFHPLKLICHSFYAILLTPVKTSIVLSLSHSLDSNRVIYHLQSESNRDVTDIAVFYTRKKGNTDFQYSKYRFS